MPKRPVLRMENTSVCHLVGEGCLDRCRRRRSGHGRHFDLIFQDHGVKG